MLCLNSIKILVHLVTFQALALKNLPAFFKVFSGYCRDPQLQYYFLHGM